MSSPPSASRPETLVAQATVQAPVPAERSATPEQKPATDASTRFRPWVTGASLLLVATLCALALSKGLLPGLLAVCLGFTLTRATATARMRGKVLVPSWVAATLTICMPLVALLALGLNAKGMSLAAVGQYQELLEHMAKTVLDIRQKLPGELASQLPNGLEAVQVWLADYLKSQASGMAQLGKVWLHGLLLAYVGLVVGALIAVRDVPADARPLTQAVRDRAKHFIEAFSSIVTAQVWIAGFNATLTALFLFVVLPLFDVAMPYGPALVALTFVAGLVPIVGNLLCNVVLAIVGVSVSPLVGLSCLSFLIAIHKFEYFINAKVVGSRTKTSAWELLAAMFAGEALFGVAGLVAAPLYYAYLKKELKAAELI